MKFIYIAIMIFCIQIGGLFTNHLLSDTSGLFPSQERQVDMGLVNEINDTRDESVEALFPGDDTGGFFGEFLFFITSLGKAIGVIALGVLVVPTTLINFGVPTYYAWLVGLPIQLLYFIGIIQIFTKQTWEGST